MSEELLRYIYTVESDYLHRIPTENDITSPGGIYRYAHPDADVWGYIDSVAVSYDIHTDSAVWTESEINLINSNLDKVTIDELVKTFYSDYMHGAHLGLFDEELQIAMFNIYTNTQVGAWKSVQQSIIDVYENNLIDIDPNRISSVDGNYGSKTREGLQIIDDSNDDIVIAFKFAMVSNMKTYYAKLVAKNPNKYLRNLSGWMNRMDRLKNY